VDIRLAETVPIVIEWFGDLSSKETALDYFRIACHAGTIEERRLDRGCDEKSE
jgi:hypothetical protein